MKLRGKLILSCTALAAVATTAFSTTYAWYTSNAVVTATGISASTAAAASDSLQISLDGNTWGATVDLTTTLATAKNLTPVARTANETAGLPGTYNIWNGDNNAVGGAATKGTNYVQFKLYFRNQGQASSVRVAATTIKNETTITSGESTVAGLPTQRTLADIGSADANYKAVDNPNYTVDLLRALDLEIATRTTTTGDNAVVLENATSWNNVSTQVFKLDNYHDGSATSAYKDTLDDSKASGYSAHQYYNAVKNLSGTGYSLATVYSANTTYYTYNSSTDTYATATVANKAAFDAGTFYYYSGAIADTDGDSGLNNFAPSTSAYVNLANTTVNTIVETTWTIYLNGWDKACFDACRGQNISMTLTFNAVADQIA